MSFLLNVSSIKWLIYELSCLWITLSRKCYVSEMSCQWNILSIKCLLSITECPRSLGPFHIVCYDIEMAMPSWTYRRCLSFAISCFLWVITLICIVYNMFCQLYVLSIKYRAKQRLGSKCAPTPPPPKYN